MRQIARITLVSWAISFAFNAFAGETFVPYQSLAEVPQTTVALWDGYDPRAEDLDVSVVKEWRNDGVVTRYLTFKVGTFKGADSRIAAYYTFPDNGKKNPAFVWSHGGGQRADKQRGMYFAKQGFATIDINWGGRPVEPRLKVNTDWGNVDASQGPQFYAKALRKAWKMDLKPDPYTIDSIASARNSNWFLVAVAGRRAISFLEQQPEVDAERLGYAGFSMGGQITSLVSIDPRLNAVAPIVGGTGFRHEDFPGGIQGSSFSRQYSANIKLYENTLDSMSYWPLVVCPVLFLNSSNDFNASFDRANKAMALLKHDSWRMSANIHENHSPGAEQWALLIKWFNQHLKGVDERIPATPASTLEFDGNRAQFTVTPEDRDARLLDTEIYFSYDPNAYTRFWKRAEAVKSGEAWRVDLDVHKNLPLYVYALCRYALEFPMETLKGGVSSSITVNSVEHVIMPEVVDLSALGKLKQQGMVFDDFKHGFRDWTVREDGRLIRTYKFQCPEINTSNDRKLCVRIDPGGRKIMLRLSTDGRFLDSRIRQGSYTFSKILQGSGPQDVIIDRTDFKPTKGQHDDELEWSRITRFDLVIRDVTANQNVDLTSDKGRGMLKRITLLPPSEL